MRGPPGHPQQSCGARKLTVRTHTIITRAGAIAFFLYFFESVVQQISCATDFVELVELCTLHGEQSHEFFRQGRRSCAETCQITREDGAVIDICILVFFRSIARFFTARSRVVALTALQTAGAFVCARDFCAVHTVHAAEPL